MFFYFILGQCITRNFIKMVYASLDNLFNKEKEFSFEQDYAMDYSI